MTDAAAKPDLYALLGVARTADADAIKRAYRRAARKAHPDAGGTEAGFRALKLAFDTLNDPERRRRYDETGEFSEVQATNANPIVRLEIIQAMRDVVLHTTNAKAKVRHQKLVELMADAIAEKRVAVQKALQLARACREGFEAVVKRSRNRKGPNMLAAIATEQLEAVAKEIDDMVQHDAALVEAREMVLNHDFDRELLLGGGAGITMSFTPAPGSPWAQL